MTTRKEHLAWCKKRAIDELTRGTVANAWASMMSDLGKHPETEGHAAIQLGSMMFFAGHLSTPTEMKKFIEGFN